MVRLSASKCSPLRRQPSLLAARPACAPSRLGGTPPKISGRANIVGGLCAKRAERMDARIAPENRCMIELAPSILSADFARLAEDALAALAGGRPVLHLDVIDG